MGLKNMTKSKNRPTKWQFFHENHQFGKVVEIKGTDGSLVPIGFSRTGTHGLKNRCRVCEGPGGGGTDGLKNRSGYGKDRGEGVGGTDGSLKIQRTAQPPWYTVTFLGLVRSDVFQVGS
jgi:hypothetical protein